MNTPKKWKLERKNGGNPIIASHNYQIKPHQAESNQNSQKKKSGENRNQIFHWKLENPESLTHLDFEAMMAEVV